MRDRVTAGTAAWSFKVAPRDVRKKIVAVSKVFSLMYLDHCDASTGPTDVLKLVFVPGSDGTLRKPKEFEFRPEPSVTRFSVCLALF